MSSNETNDISDNWMQTYTGVRFYPTAPLTWDIKIEDIAHSLSNQCRYAGHCRYFYSVAQHSVLVSRVVDEPFKLWALLHDAAEAYVQDMIRPLKLSPLGDLHKHYENEVLYAISQRFGLSWPMPEEVKRADNIVLFREKIDLIPVQLTWAGEDVWLPLARELEPIYPLSPEVAKAVFMHCFQRLYKTNF